MKAAFIVGFALSVRKALETEFKDAFEHDVLVWISEGQVAADIAKFKEVFLSRVIAGRLRQVTVFFAIPPKQEWADHPVRAVVAEARSRRSDCAIALDISRDFGAVFQVRNRLLALQLMQTEGLSEAQIRSFLSEERVICVSAVGRTSVLAALQRSGFPQEVLNSNFEEEVIPIGKNSMLMSNLEKFAKTHHHMLYAWEGLRTSSKGLIKAFKRRGSFFEADSAAKVAEAFRRSIFK